MSWPWKKKSSDKAATEKALAVAESAPIQGEKVCSLHPDSLFALDKFDAAFSLI